MSIKVTTEYIRQREKQKGKSAFTALDSSGNMHYAFDELTLGSIIQKAENKINAANSAKQQRELDAQVANNNYMSSLATQQAQAYNSAEASKDRSWQEQMSNTAHQREVADLQAAGLNPVLSAGGSGASSPSGSSASSNAQSTDMGKTAAMVELAKAEISAKTNIQMNRDNINSAQSINNKQLAQQLYLGQKQLDLQKYGYDNQLSIAEIQKQYNMYASLLGYKSSIYTADLNFSNNEAQREWQEKMYKLYPQTAVGLSGAIGQQLVDFLKYNEDSIKNAAAKGGDALKSLYSTYQKYVGQPFAGGFSQFVKWIGKANSDNYN